jgi:hypothetical protein
MAELSHEQLWQACQRTPSDLEPYGKRKRLTARQPALMMGDFRGMQVVPHPERTCPLDWGVGGNPASHRAGLLTFEHQGCAEFEPECSRLAADDSEKGQRVSVSGWVISWDERPVIVI